MRVVNVTRCLFYPREGAPLAIVQGAGWIPRSVWTGAGNLAPTGTRSPNHSARSKLVCRLRYPGPQQAVVGMNTPIQAFWTLD